MSNKTEVWKKASEVYAEISELSPQQALAHVYGIQNISLDVREAIITLINAGSQASQYYRDEISQGFHLGFNKAQNFSKGQQLDEYELLEELGHGGMAQVFKAKRINSEQQTLVAIKIFAPKDNSNELLNHFLNEQKILADLSHPNIVKMLHSGKTQDNITYLVMELIENANPLDDFCKTTNLTTKQKIKTIAQCAEALAYSHANLIIHRDLKPDNILVNEDKEVKIVDFGIAKLINKDPSGNKTTIMALTPSYAAPEQINSGLISIKTDIFSLAVVALDLLTDETPLPKDRLIKSCANDEHHIDALLKSLHIDKDLKNILHKALAQDPNKRYSSMQSFADDLNNYLSNKPVNATAQSLVYRIQKFAKRRSALFATMVSFLAFMIIGSIVGYKQYQQIKIEAQKAQVVKQFMLDSFEITDPDKALGVDISSKELLKIASDKLKNNKNLDKETKFELLQTLGMAYGKLGSYDQAINLIKQSLRIHANNSESKSYLVQYLFNSQQTKKLNQLLATINLNNFEDYSDKARILRVKIDQLINHSEFESAHQLIDDMLKQDSLESNPIEKVKTSRLLAKLFYYESQPEKSISLLTSILNDQNYTLKSTMEMGIKSDLAGLYSEIGKMDLSISSWQEIIQQKKDILGNNHPELVESLVGLSTAYMYKGNIKEANLLADEAYTISLKLFGENNLATAATLNTKSVLLKTEGKYKQAIELTYKVIKIYENQQSVNYQDTNIIKANLAQILMAQNRNEEALNVISGVYEYQLENLGKDHPDTLFSQQILVRTYIGLGNSKQAVILAKEAVDNAQEAIKRGVSTSDTVGSYYTLALAYQADKQYQLAIENYLYLINNKMLDPEGLNYAILQLSIANMYNEMNDFENAQKHYLKTLELYKKIYSLKHLKTLNVQLKYIKLLKSNNRTVAMQEQLANLNEIIDKNNIVDEDLIKQLDNL